VRNRVRGEQYERNRALLAEMVWRHQMPVLTGTETPYRVPPSTPMPIVYRGLPLDQVGDVVVTSSTWKQVAPFLLPREEVQAGRPITPLHAGHVGVLCTAGLLNDVFGQGSERHIARWRMVKSVTVFELKENGFKEIHKRERFTNELALIHEDGANGTAGPTFIMNLEQTTKDLTWATVVGLPGLPADPRWGNVVLGELLIRRLDGIGCDPAVVIGTQEDFTTRMGQARALGLLPFPEKNGPVVGGSASCFLPKIQFPGNFVWLR
jgi:hypothetical protein